MRLLYAGQLHDYKGVHVLLEAADRLARQGMRVAVTIAGDGPADYKARLEAFARGSAAPVAFLGRLPQDRLAAVYRTHDVLVFPSEWAEPFGLTHLEAMASGTVVISTAHGGQGEFLEDGINARVFPAGDAGALADRIAGVREAPDLARRIAAAARARVLRDFTVDRYAASLEALLAQAAAAAAWRAA
jgi:glycosyltransferase involved in cell wall biosynthesis